MWTYLLLIRRLVVPPPPNLVFAFFKKVSKCVHCGIGFLGLDHYGGSTAAVAATAAAAAAGLLSDGGGLGHFGGHACLGGGGKGRAS